ncbi:MAG TPA: ABC transporter substrate-binding protein [Candidatus Binatia bacterium]|jgi:ABC-type nitrate/sulfonate/bicarbonate transport system substrate-binding protein
MTFCIILFLISASSVFAQEKKLEPLVVSYASVSGSRGPLWVAKEMGIFEKYGLDGKPLYVPAGYPSVSALISGDVHFIATGGSVVAAAAAKGAPVVIVATLGPIAYKLMAHPSISSVEGLRGKVIGGLRPGTTTDFVLQRFLLKLGLVPGKDVTILPTGLSRSDDRLLLMFQGKFQATLGTVDNVSQLELKGLKVNVLADPLELGVPTPASDISTTRQFLANHRNRAKAFLKAFCEAIWLGRNDKEVAFRAYRKYMRIEDPKLLESMHRNYFLISIPPKPYPIEDGIQADIVDLSSTITELKGRNASDFMDIALLKELESEGFFARLHGQKAR